MWWWDRIIEDKLRTANEQGLFDNLRGAGKPLSLDDETGGEDWLGNHMLHEAGLLPVWLELRKEIAAERGLVKAAFDDYWHHADRLERPGQPRTELLVGLEERYGKLAREINRKIDEHNMRCPSIGHELARFPEDAIARRRQRSLRG